MNNAENNFIAVVGMFIIYIATRSTRWERYGQMMVYGIMGTLLLLTAIFPLERGVPPHEVWYCQIICASIGAVIIFIAGMIVMGAGESDSAKEKRVRHAEAEKKAEEAKAKYLASQA